MKIFNVVTLALLLSFSSTSVFAEEGHEHKSDNDHKEESHQEEDGHKHDKDESENEDNHDESEDEHGHGEEHEEGRTEIDATSALAAGIKTSVAGVGDIQEVLTLTGRIMLNRNTTADVRARFAGVVKSVDVSWGDKVKKGQTLATVEANESLRVYTIYSPIDGIVLNRNTNVGNVAGDEAIFTIADLSEVWAEFHVFPRDLAKVAEKQKVRVHTLEDSKQIESPIKLILPTADALSQTVIAVVSVDNKDSKWRPGMAVEGDVHISETKVPVAITEKAIQRMENKTVIFVKEGAEYEMRQVKLGKSDGKYIEVLEGLEAGEEYVSEGSFIVKADIGKAAAKHEH